MHACPSFPFIRFVSVPRLLAYPVGIRTKCAETSVLIPVSILERPGEVLLAIEDTNGSALVIGVSPTLRAICREGVEAVVHFLRAASFFAVTFPAPMAISVDNVVDAVAEGFVWRVLVPGFAALSAAFRAVRKEGRGLLAHDHLIIGVRPRSRVHTRLLLPHDVADFGA